MKKVFIYALALSSVFFACSDDNSGEVEDLKKQLEAEKTKTATGINFEGDNMIISFSNGTQTTVSTSDVLQGPKGDTGVRGDTGNGIASIVFNSETGVLTITMTNGEKSEFSITETLDGHTAVLIDDSRGSCFLKTLYLGAVPAIENEYDADYNLLKSTTRVAINGQVLKSNVVEKTYSSGQWTGIKTTEYATENTVKYTSEYMDSWESVELTENKGDFVENGYAFIYQYSVGSNRYYYQKYRAFTSDQGQIVKVLNNDRKTYTLFEYNSLVNVNSQDYYLYIKYSLAIQTDVVNGFYKESDRVIYRMYDRQYYNGNTGSYENWSVAEYKYTKTGTYKIGEIVSEKSYQLECNNKNQILKAHSSDTRYTQLSYNAAGKLEKVEEYENGATTGRVVTFLYTNDLLTSAKDEKGTEQMKVEYDDNKNPVAIYMRYEASEREIFDPWSSLTNPYRYVEQSEAGLRLIAKVEYYDYKNPLGNTVGAIWPVLNDFKINNAIKRFATVEGMVVGSLEYKDFNAYGYPQTITGTGTAHSDGLDGDAYIGLELMLDYAVKENK